MIHFRPYDTATASHNELYLGIFDLYSHSDQWWDMRTTCYDSSTGDDAFSASQMDHLLNEFQDWAPAIDILRSYLIELGLSTTICDAAQEWHELVLRRWAHGGIDVDAMIDATGHLFGHFSRAWEMASEHCPHEPHELYALIEGTE